MYVNVDAAFEMNRAGSVGRLGIIKPPNEKPIGKFKVELLREAVEMMEENRYEEAYMWSTNNCEKETIPPGCIAFTKERDDDHGVAVAPRVMNDE